MPPGRCPGHTTQPMALGYDGQIEQVDCGKRAAPHSGEAGRSRERDDRRRSPPYHRETVGRPGRPQGRGATASLRSSPPDNRKATLGLLRRLGVGSSTVGRIRICNLVVRNLNAVRVPPATDLRPLRVHRQRTCRSPVERVQRFQDRNLDPLQDYIATPVSCRGKSARHQLSKPRALLWPRSAC